MWALMPSSVVNPVSKFFTFLDVKTLAESAEHTIPVLKGKIWAGDERSPGWAVECESFESFQSAVQQMRERIEILAFDESVLDEDTLRILQEDLYRYSDEEGISPDLVQKAMAALRSHENELFAVLAYAFLPSGHVVFARAQNELARFVYQPDRLLSREGLLSVRKLKTLIEN